MSQAGLSLTLCVEPIYLRTIPNRRTMPIRGYQLQPRLFEARINGSAPKHHPCRDTRCIARWTSGCQHYARLLTTAAVLGCAESECAHPCISHDRPTSRRSRLQLPAIPNPPLFEPAHSLRLAQTYERGQLRSVHSCHYTRPNRTASLLTKTQRSLVAWAGFEPATSWV